MDKKKEFFNLLRKSGVTEYWSDSFFNPSDEHPFAEILLPIDNDELVLAVDDLYNDYEDERKSLLVIKAEDKGSYMFNVYAKGKGRREVEV